MMRCWPSVAPFALAMLANAGAEAAKKNYSATLRADQENVPPTLGGKDPSASAVLTYDDQTRRLCGTITYRDLTGPPTSIHIRQSPSGNPEGDGPDNRSFVLPAPPGNELALSLLFDTGYQNALYAGEMYANIYTQANPSGEIRSTLYESADQSEAANVPCPTLDAGADASPPPVPRGSSGGTDGTGAMPAIPTSGTSESPRLVEKERTSDGGCAIGGGAGGALPFLAALLALVARVRGKR
jgi:hypothetical protein